MGKQFWILHASTSLLQGLRVDSQLRSLLEHPSGWENQDLLCSLNPGRTTFTQLWFGGMVWHVNTLLELSTEEIRANLYPQPDAREAPAPYVYHRTLQNLPLETKGHATEVIFATGRRSSHLEEGARRCHFFKWLQGSRSHFPPKDDPQDDSVRLVKPDVLNRTGLKPVYTHKGNTSLTDKSLGRDEDKPSAQDSLADQLCKRGLCQQRVVKHKA